MAGSWMNCDPLRRAARPATLHHRANTAHMKAWLYLQLD
jgi:hypothetical protein